MEISVIRSVLLREDSASLRSRKLRDKEPLPPATVNPPAAGTAVPDMAVKKAPSELSSPAESAGRPPSGLCRSLAGERGSELPAEVSCSVIRRSDVESESTDVIVSDRLLKRFCMSRSGVRSEWADASGGGGETMPVSPEVAKLGGAGITSMSDGHGGNWTMISRSESSSSCGCADGRGVALPSPESRATTVASELALANSSPVEIESNDFCDGSDNWWRERTGGVDGHPPNSAGFSIGGGGGIVSGSDSQSTSPTSTSLHSSERVVSDDEAAVDRFPSARRWTSILSDPFK